MAKVSHTILCMSQVTSAMPKIAQIILKTVFSLYEITCNGVHERAF